VHLRDVTFPEFHDHHRLNVLTARMLKEKSVRYDIILGRRTLLLFGFKVNFAENVVTRNDPSVSMRSYSHYQVIPDKLSQLAVLLLDLIKSNLEPEDTFFAATEILPSKYNPKDVDELIQDSQYFNTVQQNDLQFILSTFPVLFNGKLQTYTAEKIHFDIDPEATPRRAHAYLVPRAQLNTFKGELKRLQAEGGIEQANRARRIARTLIIPRKDGCVRWITDFHRLLLHLLKLATPFLRWSSMTLILQNAKRPRAVAVEDLAKRLRSINQMMQYLPGANKAAPYNDQERKMIFYQMMPSDWELTFLKTGRQLTDATQSLTYLARYMKFNESVSAIWRRMYS